MPRQKHKVDSSPSGSFWDYQVRLLAWLAVCISVLSFLFYFREGAVLLYGDAVAHINIARRVFDSQTPGLLQLGTVWLPLPHLLMIPFLLSDKLWINGVGGSIPSMAAYVLGVIGVFRLARGLVSKDVTQDNVAKNGDSVSFGVAPWIAAGIFAANPNLIYMQATAMGESLYLALFIWAVVFFNEFVRGDAKALRKSGLCVAAACLTRYDGWFLAATVAVVSVGMFFVHSVQKREGNNRTHSVQAMAGFVLLCAAAPAFWLAYNATVYGNPLEFANGPYSARAIEHRTGTINPAKGSAHVACSYFVKAAEENVAEPPWLERLWLALGLGGIALTLAMQTKSWPILLLLVPLPFYMLSLAYGSVPIFVPQWWPFSQYNVRYGLELLPAFAVSIGVLTSFANKFPQPGKRLAAGAVLVVVAIVAAGYFSVWSASPICFREAEVNSRTRMPLESQLAKWLEVLPPQFRLLMYLGGHPGIVEQAGIPLRRVINEGNHRVWMQPSDPDGLWERALSDPAKYADYAIAFEGDPVWKAVKGRGFQELVEISTTRQPRAVLFQLQTASR